ncbi:hypothetical protein [Streptomyces sp. NPDC058377]|uniref:hypothetical protein n=1 Tax=unclassified Streptomyces TaxID=2593676 RepID=UPI00364ACBEB
MGVGILLMVCGAAGVGWGAMYLFDLRGAADKAAARRNAVRAVTAARTLDLGLAQPSRLGASFFRAIGGVVLPCGLVLGLIGLALTLTG